MPSNFNVRKASGAIEPFSEEKVRHSIRRARIPKQLENQVIKHIYDILYDGIPTSEIYRHISEFLGKSKQPYTKSRYGLKQAIMQLGPSGFPFEKFVAEVLQKHGYSTSTNQIVKGKCVDHEIDVIAEKNGKRYLVECKFHSKPGVRSDVKVALYTYARFKDIQPSLPESSSDKYQFNNAWLVTNTKTTSEAIKYSECMGLQIIGWNYPEHRSLQDLVENAGLHPITSLYSLNQEQMLHILRRGIVLSQDLLSEKDEVLVSLGITEAQHSAIKKEIEALCLLQNENKSKKQQ